MENPIEINSGHSHDLGSQVRRGSVKRLALANPALVLPLSSDTAMDIFPQLLHKWSKMVFWLYYSEFPSRHSYSVTFWEVSNMESGLTQCQAEIWSATMSLWAHVPGARGSKSGYGVGEWHSEWQVPLWRFPHGELQNGWLVRGNPTKMDDDWGVPLFQETSICANATKTYNLKLFQLWNAKLNPSWWEGSPNSQRHPRDIARRSNLFMVTPQILLVKSTCFMLKSH